MSDTARASIEKALDEEVIRVDQAGHVQLKLDVLSDHEVYATDDGTVAGIFVKTSQPMPIGTPMTLDVLLPWGETLVVEGKVAWVRELTQTSVRHRSGMGVGFVNLAVAQHGLLERAMILREPMRVPLDARRE